MNDKTELEIMEGNIKALLIEWRSARQNQCHHSDDMNEIVNRLQDAVIYDLNGLLHTDEVSS